MNNIINELVKKIDNPNIVKALIIGFIALYVIAPDAIPGPADDHFCEECDIMLWNHERKEGRP